MNRNGRQGRNHDQHGPTERELKMIALDEAGMTADEIGAEMGLRADYVERRLIQLSIFDTPRDLAFFAMCRRGSMMLGARIDEVFGRTAQRSASC